MKSKDAAENLAVSADFTFTTLASLDTGLVGYWKFDEGAGTTAADSSGNGNTGMLIRGPLKPPRAVRGIDVSLVFRHGPAPDPWTRPARRCATG